MIEGVDYSSTAHGNWTQLAAALKAAGKHFVGRYAVGDKSPAGRGITAAEYTAMTAAGIDVFLYWESSAGWMAGGRAAGVSAAQNAQANIVAAGMPANTPVYFACDFDAAPSDQSAIDNCLRGAASVIGADRVGLYAGYHVLLRSKQNGTAKWFCQTSAWSGGLLMDGVHLYQYDYNKYIDGTNCDWVRAYQDNYGQATPPIIDAPIVTTTPAPPKPSGPVYPRGMTKELANRRFGHLNVNFDGKEYDIHFDEDGPISRAWLAMINAQLGPNDTYRDAQIGPIESVIRRGKDHRYWDYAFTGMGTVTIDTTTGKVVE